VAFTFSLIQKFPALNVNGVNFKSVSQSGDNVTLTFSSPAYGQLYLISQVLMVPQHIWSTISNPVTYTDTAPIGTGPYLLKSFSSQSFTLTKNPHYWMPGEPHMSEIRLVQYASNTSADLALQQGSIDWASIFEPHYQKLFIGADPQHNHVFLPAIGAEYVCLNDAKYPFNMPAVRKALSYAFDRSKMSTAVEQGFAVPMTSPTGLLPDWNQFVAPQYKSLALSYDPAKAKSMLLAAGFKMGSNGKMLMPNGQPFQVTFTGPTPYTDFMADMQLMSSSLNSIGVQSSLTGVGLSAWTTAYTVGNYQATMCGTFQTPGPYELYNLQLNGNLSAPIGKNAVGDYERWINPATNAALTSYGNTNNAAAQQASLYKLQGIMVNQVPLIPLFGLTSYAEYRTANATGWVTANNQYQMPNPSSPWDETVVLHLRPTG
jgi:peptide/nickel transport system substrate-binding protein